MKPKHYPFSLARIGRAVGSLHVDGYIDLVVEIGSEAKILISGPSAEAVESVEFRFDEDSLHVFRGEQWRCASGIDASASDTQGAFSIRSNSNNNNIVNISWNQS